MDQRDTAGIGSKDPSLHRVTIHQMVEDLASYGSQYRDKNGGDGRTSILCVALFEVTQPLCELFNRNVFIEGEKVTLSGRSCIINQ